MRILIKPGVRFVEVNAPFFAACAVVWKAYQEQGAVPTITSAADGEHMAASLHYKGLAWDFRVSDIKNPGGAAVIINNMLNADGKLYDVLFGDPKHLDHIHIEYDPKEGKGSWELKVSCLL